MLVNNHQRSSTITRVESTARTPSSNTSSGVHSYGNLDADRISTRDSLELSGVMNHFPRHWNTNGYDKWPGRSRTFTGGSKVPSRVTRATDIWPARFAWSYSSRKT